MPAARSASSRRRSASAVRVRARSATADATDAATRKTPSATQCAESSIISRPVGGMWKKLNAAALSRLVSRPIASPQYTATSSTASR